MKEGHCYKLDLSEAERFFRAHKDELKETQLLCDFAMDVLEELMLDSSEVRSYIHLSSIIHHKRKQHFVFYYIRFASEQPAVERFFVDEKSNKINRFFIEYEDAGEAKLFKSLIFHKREL